MLIEAWLIFALLSFTSYAISTFIDKINMNRKYAPIETNTLKMCSNAIILLGIGVIFLQVEFSIKALLWSLPLGILYAISGIFYFKSLQLKDVDLVIPYEQALSTFLIFIGAILLFDESFTLAKTFGVVLVLFGGYLVITKKFLHIPEFDKGLFFIMGAGITGVVYALLIKQVLFDITPISLAIIMYAATTITMMLFLFIEAKVYKRKVREHFHFHPTIIIASFFGAMGTLLLYSAVALGEASSVFSLRGLQSVLLLVLSIIFFRELLDKKKLAGIVAVAIGIYLIVL